MFEKVYLLHEKKISFSLSKSLTDQCICFTCERKIRTQEELPRLIYFQHRIAFLKTYSVRRQQGKLFKNAMHCEKLTWQLDFRQTKSLPFPKRILQKKPFWNKKKSAFFFIPTFPRECRKAKGKKGRAEQRLFISFRFFQNFLLCKITFACLVNLFNFYSICFAEKFLSGYFGIQLCFLINYVSNCCTANVLVKFVNIGLLIALTRFHINTNGRWFEYM